MCPRCQYQKGTIINRNGVKERSDQRKTFGFHQNAYSPGRQNILCLFSIFVNDYGALDV